MNDEGVKVSVETDPITMEWKILLTVPLRVQRNLAQDRLRDAALGGIIRHLVLLSEADSQETP